MSRQKQIAALVARVQDGLDAAKELLERAREERARWDWYRLQDERRGTSHTRTLIVRRANGDDYRSWRFEATVDRSRWCRFGAQLELEPETVGLCYLHLPFVSLYPGDLIPDAVARAIYPRFERWFGDRRPERQRNLRTYDARKIRCEFFRNEDGPEPTYYFWWDFWSPEGIGFGEDDWWRRQHHDLKTVLFGYDKCTRELIRSDVVTISMPERDYQWKIEEERLTYKRPRWPWPVQRTIISLDALEGEHIPIPGKGENAWDIGMDAAYGMGLGSGTTWESAAEYVAAKMTKDRERRGWTDEDAKAFVASVRAKHANPSDPTLARVDDG